jgi:AcrR family transcriptional regulator
VQKAERYGSDVSWVDRAADRAPVTRSESRAADHAEAIVAAAERLMAERGSSFTTQDVVREAGVALKTFYRHFESKDKLLLAVFEDMTARATERYREAGEQLPDPVARLRLGMTAALEAQDDFAGNGPQFITAEYWRLYELFPEEMTRATQTFVDAAELQLRAAVDAGLLHSDDPASDAWLMTKMVMAVYHHRAFAPLDPPAADAKERVWAFCLAALGGRPHS